MMNDDKAITQTMREYNELLYIMPYNAQHIGDREEQQDYFAYSNLLDPVEVSRSGNGRDIRRERVFERVPRLRRVERRGT